VIRTHGSIWRRGDRAGQRRAPAPTASWIRPSISTADASSITVRRRCARRAIARERQSGALAIAPASIVGQRLEHDVLDRRAALSAVGEGTAHGQLGGG